MGEKLCPKGGRHFQGAGFKKGSDEGGTKRQIVGGAVPAMGEKETKKKKKKNRPEGVRSSHRWEKQGPTNRARWMGGWEKKKKRPCPAAKK